MMKRKAIIPLLLGLGIGLATVKLAVDTIRKAQAASKTAATVKVVWAKEDIDAYEAIGAEMVEVIETGDSRFAPADDRFESVQDVVGRVPSKPIPQKTPVLKSALTPAGTPAGLVGKIPVGFRAVSVKITEESSVAYQIKPGDWVDVIVVMDVATSAGGGGKDTISEVILQRVQVGAIGSTTASGSDAASGKVKPAKSVTLLVHEEDVPKLHLAGTRGKVTLAMRGDDDLTTSPFHKASMDDVIPGSGSVETPPTGTPPSAPSMSWGHALVGFLATPPPGQPDASTRWSSEEENPYSLLVVRGSAAAGAAPAVVERLTFENANSSTILEATGGLPTRASSRMRGSRDASVRTPEPGSRPDEQRLPETDDRTGSSNDDE